MTSFGAATTLTSWHLMVTFCTLHAAQRFNLFENKPIDMKTVMLFGILNGVSIGLLNLSLGFNSIGFYQVEIYSKNYLPKKLAIINLCPYSLVGCLFWQMTKLAIIPFTVLLETIFLKKQFRFLSLLFSFYLAITLLRFKANQKHFFFHLLLQPEDKAFPLPSTCWSWHCLYNWSPAQSCWVNPFSPCHCNNLCWPNCILLLSLLSILFTCIQFSKTDGRQIMT